MLQEKPSSKMAITERHSPAVGPARPYGVARLSDRLGQSLTAPCDGRVPTLMRLARHRSFVTTQRYLKLDEAHLRDAVVKLLPAEPRSEP
jgi:hypothetical protein